MFLSNTNLLLRRQRKHGQPRRLATVPAGAPRDVRSLASYRRSVPARRHATPPPDGEDFRHLDAEDADADREEVRRHLGP